MPHTSHGHPYGTINVDDERPTTPARCGGPRICEVCAGEAEQGGAETTPVDELRQAAAILRNPYRCGSVARMESEANLLDAIADGIDELGAVEASASKAVHPTTPLGLGAPNRSWTAALAVARAINGTHP